MKLSHVDGSGQARMVDVGAKVDSGRIAVAEGQVKMAAETLELIKNNGLQKGDVLNVAKIAGIMAAKQCPNLIPLCHSLNLTGIDLRFKVDELTKMVKIRAEVSTIGKTGVEMEALTAVSVSALTIYDMCKAVDRTMVIEGIRLLKKEGGKGGKFILEEGSEWLE